MHRRDRRAHRGGGCPAALKPRLRPGARGRTRASGRPTRRRMSSLPRSAALVAAAALAACQDREGEQARLRAAAEAAALDTASRAWRHAVGVDSVVVRGDTTTVWVSPRNWMATDAPQAGVRVSPDGRVASVQWILGG